MRENHIRARRAAFERTLTDAICYTMAEYPDCEPLEVIPSVLVALDERRKMSIWACFELVNEILEELGRERLKLS